MIAIIIIAVSGIILDQISKFALFDYLFAEGVSIGGHYTLINNVLDLTPAYNTGMAFSMLDGAQWLFIPFTLIVCALIIYFVIRIKHRHWLLKTTVGMILAGAMGNLIDRIAFGAVRDFIDVRTDKIFGFSFAVFNVADCFIVVGTIVAAIYILFVHDKYMKQFGNEKPEGKDASDNS